MKIQISSDNITCVELSKLLGLEVRQIATTMGDLETPGGLEISVTAKEADITADHIAVLTEIYGGQSVELITEDTKDETITR